MPNRSGFQSSIQEFLTKSNDEILGELTKFQEGSVETTPVSYTHLTLPTRIFV